MILFDSNVFIYAANQTIDSSKFKDIEVGYASITLIEALGFHDITSAEQRALQHIFSRYQSFELTSPIIERAIALRQSKNMSLGDAIVAATALENDLELWTANTDDFKHIDGLKLLNPLQ